MLPEDGAPFDRGRAPFDRGRGGTEPAPYNKNSE